MVLPDWLKELGIWYFLGESPAAQPGKANSAEVSLVYQDPWSWIFGSSQTTLFGWLALVVVGGFFCLRFWSRLAPLSTAKKSFLVGLRVASLLLIIGLLCLPALEIREVGLPLLPVLIDTSGSMSIADVPVNDKTSAGRADVEKLSRLTAIREALTRDDSQWLRQLQKRFDLRLYQFSHEATPIEWPPTPSQGFTLEATGLTSRIGPSVQQVMDELRGSPLAGVVVLTDGVPNPSSAEALSAIGSLLASRSIPVFPVAVGSDREVADLELVELNSDDVAFQNDPLIVVAQVKGSGILPQTVKVTLKEGASGKVLETRDLFLNGSKKLETVEFSWIPESPGEFSLVAEVAPLADEPDQENNRQTRKVKVRGGKLRVLLVESTPRYEFRFLKQFLEREPSVELQTLLQEADLEYAKEDRTAIRNFPIRREDFAALDVLILGDIDPRLLSPSSLELIDDFVRNQGGGLIVIAGELNNPSKWSGSILEKLLPFRVSDAQLPERAETPFQPLLTFEATRGSRLFRFAQSPAENQSIWNELAPWFWSLQISALKPGASVLVERQDRGQRTANPLIILQRVGVGKVLFLATDETWRWRFRQGDHIFGKFWVQAIRFMSRRQNDDEEPVRFLADRATYEIGQKVHLTLEVRDERALPQGTEKLIAQVESAEGQLETIELRRTGQSAAFFEADWTPVREGPYRLQMVDDKLLAKLPLLSILVTAPQKELLATAASTADLKLAAEATRGQYLPIDRIEELPELLPRSQLLPVATIESVRIWNRWELLILLGSLICLEWGLRRRWQTL